MPASIDPSITRLWCTVGDDSLGEQAWSERLLERLCAALGASRALLLSGAPPELTCRARSAACTPEEAAALEHEVRERLAGPEGARGWTSPGCAGAQAFGCVLNVAGRSDGALLALREQSWSAQESAFLRELSGAVADAVARRRALAALRQSEARYRIVSELGADYAFSASLREDGTWATEWFTGARRAQQLQGAPVDDPTTLGRFLGDVVPEGRAAFLRLADLCARTRQPATATFRSKTRTGEVRTLKLDCLPVWGASDVRLTRMYGRVQDVTDEVQARAALERQRDHCRALVEACPVGLVHVSPEGVLLDCNEAAAALLGGGSKERLVGRPTTDFAPLGEAGRSAGALAQLKAGRLPTALRWAGRSADGREIVCDVLLRPLRVGEGAATEGFLALVREAAGSAVAGLAAQLGDLISAVLGNAGLALSTLDSDSPARADLLQAIAAAEGAAALLRPKAPAARREGKARARVVVIEPEELVRRVASTILEREGFDVVPLASAVEIDRALREPVSELAAAVLDVREPTEEATETIRALRAARPGLPMVLTSALEHHEIGADDPAAVHLPKPYSRDQLAAAIARAVARPANRA